MKQRFSITLLLLFAVFILPWWVNLVFLLLAFSFLPWYFGGVVLVLIYELIYSVEPKVLWLGLVIFISLFFIEELKRRLYVFS